MYPPADPWATPDEPTPALPPAIPRYGRAAVPVPKAPLREPTADMPILVPKRQITVPVSWYKTSRASRRSLSDGWGLTATGLLALFCGWGLWAASGRGIVAAPLVGLGLVLVVGVGVFVLCRFVGYLVLERMMGRVRLHARWAHFLTGAFLTASGISYLLSTTWLGDVYNWVRDEWQHWLT
jgi:hypothetical protein